MCPTRNSRRWTRSTTSSSGRTWIHCRKRQYPQLILRYLAAFGPASAKDIQKWSGLTRIQQGIEMLRPELLALRDEQGRELFDLPGAPRPAADTPAPVHFLSAFDNLLLSYAEHGRIIAEEYYPIVFSINGQLAATFLVDGFVRGQWKIEHQPASATLVIEPFEPLSEQVHHELREEGALQRPLPRC